METDDWIIDNIQGAKAFIDWFGSWPSFHDAEVIELHLARSESSWIKIHTWNMTQEVDSEGFFVTEKNAIVTFEMDDVEDLELKGFSGQNVVSELKITPIEECVELRLSHCYGVSGRIKAAKIRIEFAQGSPEN
jgi:hypothetical protein